MVRNALFVEGVTWQVFFSRGAADQLTHACYLNHQACRDEALALKVRKKGNYSRGPFLCRREPIKPADTGKLRSTLWLFSSKILFMLKTNIALFKLSAQYTNKPYSPAMYKPYFNLDRNTRN